MLVRIKIAQSAKEMADVFRLRYRVFVEDEGILKGLASHKSKTIFDLYDALPLVANIIAYSSNEPVGTIRINLDTGAGLPSDEFGDFSGYKKEIEEQWKNSASNHLPLRFGSAGMLAIHSDWRKRRDVIMALFKMGAGAGRNWGCSHIIATPIAKTATMYMRLGFKKLGTPHWVDEVGDDVQAVAGAFDDFYNWTFGGLMENERFLSVFANRFQRVILGKGETLFKEGDPGREAYIIDTGTIRVSRTTSGSQGESTLAMLGRGDLFGELSLIDAKPRSANVTALTNVELVALDREDFMCGLKENPAHMEDMLELFAARIRRTDELIAVMQGSGTQRMDHALEDICNSAAPDRKRPGMLLAKVGLTDFARNAGVSESEAKMYLDMKKEMGIIEYNEYRIWFPTAAKSNKQQP